MKTATSLIFMIIGLLSLVSLIIPRIRRKDYKTYSEIMIAASAGAFISGGIILLII